MPAEGNANLPGPFSHCKGGGRPGSLARWDHFEAGQPSHCISPRSRCQTCFRRTPRKDKLRLSCKLLRWLVSLWSRVLLLADGRSGFPQCRAPAAQLPVPAGLHGPLGLSVELS